jgi:hypothetical protein
MTVMPGLYEIYYCISSTNIMSKVIRVTDKKSRSATRVPKMPASLWGIEGAGQSASRLLLMALRYTAAISRQHS